MTEVVTYLRVNINGKWTNLGIVAEEDEIKEHFEFVEDLLMQKKVADRAEKRLNSLKEYIPCLRSAIESTLYYSHPDIEPNLQSDIGSYSSLMEQICKDLEEDGE